QGRRARGQFGPPGRAYGRENSLPSCRKGQRPAGWPRAGESGRRLAPLRHALHLSTRSANYYRNELSRAGEKIWARAIRGYIVTKLNRAQPTQSCDDLTMQLV